MRTLILVALFCLGLGFAAGPVQAACGNANTANMDATLAKDWTRVHDMFNRVRGCDGDSSLTGKFHQSLTNLLSKSPNFSKLGELMHGDANFGSNLIQHIKSVSLADKQMIVDNIEKHCPPKEAFCAKLEAATH